MEVVQSGSTLMGSSVSGPGVREGLEVVQSDATFCVAGAAGSGGVDVLKFVSRCCVAGRTGSAWELVVIHRVPHTALPDGPGAAVSMCSCLRYAAASQVGPGARKGLT